MSIGVPIKLLHEAENHVITCELKSGELYRGYLMEAEDTMNMSNIKFYVWGAILLWYSIAAGLAAAFVWKPL